MLDRAGLPDASIRRKGRRLVDETHDCRLAAMQRPSRRAGFAEHLDPARKSQERLVAAAVATWRGAEGRNTWPTLLLL